MFCIDKSKSRPFRDYLDAKAIMSKAKQDLEDAEIALWNAYEDQLSNASMGTTHICDDVAGFKLSVVKKETYKVDEKAWKKSGLESSAIKEKVSYTVDKKAYDSLTDDNRACLNKFIETKMAKPSFSVEVLNDNQD